MGYKIQTISVFERQAKRLVKKYPSLKKELRSLVEALENDPKIGIALTKNCFKIRISIASKGKGKSGGARIITHLVVTEKTVFLLAIYDKSEKENLTDRELIELLSFLP